MGAHRRTIDLARLASQLSGLAESVRQQSAADFGDDRAEATGLSQIFRDGCDPELVMMAQAWVRANAERDAAFDPGLFSDPAWNMLLDLYIQRSKGAAVSVSSLVVAAGTPATTALRWIALLEARGLVTRRPDHLDKRRSFVAITDLAVERVETALRGAARSDRKLGLARLQRFD